MRVPLIKIFSRFERRGEGKSSELEAGGCSKKSAASGLGDPAKGLLVGIRNIFYNAKEIDGRILEFSQTINP